MKVYFEYHKRQIPSRNMGMKYGRKKVNENFYYIKAFKVAHSYLLTLRLHFINEIFDK